MLMGSEKNECKVSSAPATGPLCGWTFAGCTINTLNVHIQPTPSVQIQPIPSVQTPLAFSDEEKSDKEM